MNFEYMHLEIVYSSVFHYDNTSLIFSLRLLSLVMSPIFVLIEDFSLKTYLASRIFYLMIRPILIRWVNVTDTYTSLIEKPRYSLDNKEKEMIQNYHRV